LNNGKGKSKGSGSSFVDEKTKWKLVVLASDFVDMFDDDNGDGSGSGNRDGGNGEEEEVSSGEFSS
jgi:hypothetical protein